MAVVRMKPEVPVVTMEEARADSASVVIPHADGELYYPEAPEHRAVSYADHCFLPVVVKEVLTLLRNGATRDDSCAVVGIPKQVFNSWYKRNHGNFRIECDKAEAKCKVAHIIRINKGDKNWSNSAWFLEKRHRGEYGSDPKTVINVKEMNTIVTQLVNVVSNRLGSQAPDVIEKIAQDLQSMGLIEDASKN